jgi:hypothetical protein
MKIESPKFIPKLKTVFGLCAILVLAGCSLELSSATRSNSSSPTSSDSALYFPENANPPLNPNFSFTLANGSIIEGFNRDGKNRIFSPEEMHKYLDPLCQTPIDDKKIPIYFIKDAPCDNDANLGCTKRDPSTNEQYVEIGAKK